MAPGVSSRTAGVTAHSSSHEVHSSVPPTLRAFRLLMLLLSYFILLRLATPALRLGVIAGSWPRSEAYVLPYWSATLVLVRCTDCSISISSALSSCMTRAGLEVRGRAVCPRRLSFGG